ncbi:MAG: hypothetical protein NT029_01295 [Armatimonadetes bacterium]|nr:hypothetical protein [Armatimonadota bacterium]
MYIACFVVILAAVVGSAALTGRRACGTPRNGVEPLLLLALALWALSLPVAKPFAPGGGLGLGFALGAMAWYLAAWTLRAGARQEGAAYCVAPGLVVLATALGLPDPVFVFGGAALAWISGAGCALAFAQSEPSGPGLGRSAMPLLQGAAVLLVAAVARESHSMWLAVATVGVAPYAMHAVRDLGGWAPAVLAMLAAGVAGMAAKAPADWLASAAFGLVAGFVSSRAVADGGAQDRPAPGLALVPGVVAVFAALALSRREGGAVTQLSCLMPLLGALSVSVRRPLSLIGGSTAGLAGFGAALVILTVVRRRLLVGTQIDVQQTASDLALLSGVLLPLAAWALPALGHSGLKAAWRVAQLWGGVLVAGAALVLLFHSDGMALFMMGASLACVVGLLSGRDGATPVPTALWVAAFGTVIALWAVRADNALDTWEVSRRAATYVLAALTAVAWIAASRIRGKKHAG